MGIKSTNKTLTPALIACGGTAEVKIEFTAVPNIAENPVDIVILLDRSSSMRNKPFADMKAASKYFVNLIYQNTGGTSDIIAGGTKIGVVTFDGKTDVTADIGLSDNRNAINNAIDNIETPDDGTNINLGFQTAGTVLGTGTNTKKIIVLFSDGIWNDGGDPAATVAALKGAPLNAEIYVIGFNGADGINRTGLQAWASTPTNEHYSETTDTSELNELFGNIAKDISEPGAINVIVTETVRAGFTIDGIVSFSPTTSVFNPANPTGMNSFVWSIPEVGASGEETAFVIFRVKHDGVTPITDQPINASLTLIDDEQQTIPKFPNPTINVQQCSNCYTSYPEACAQVTDVEMGSCVDSMVYPLNDYQIQSLGRVLQLNVRIKNVCYGKRVALSVVLNEVDVITGDEYPRGLKCVVVPAQTDAPCKDICVNCIKFSLPEELVTDTGGDPTKLCNSRTFYVRVIAQHIDHNYSCCNTATL